MNSIDAAAQRSSAADPRSSSSATATAELAVRPLAPRDLPDKIRLCVLDGAGRPVRGVPVELRIEGSSANLGSGSVSAGLLASNHVGYLAFDVAARRAQLFDAITGVHAVLPASPPVRIDLTERLALSRGRGGPAGAAQGGLIPLTLPAGAVEHGHGAQGHEMGRGLASIQSPDVADWLLSPGSFGVDAVPVVGEGGCETLLPSHAAERIVRLHQLVRLPAGAVRPPIVHEEKPPPPRGWPRELEWFPGELRHYELVWLPLNHGLGKVLYSLTLAPCEAVRVAVIDWSRTEEAARTDAARLSDDLTHALRRDRSVEEVVNAVLRERQSGESFLGGMAGVGGYGGGLGGGGAPAGGGAGGAGAGGAVPGGGEGGGAPAAGAQGGGGQAGQSWGVTGSHSLGYAMASSSGDRDVDVETTQAVVDEIAQASHLVRDLRSTVVVQAAQSEREALQTRIVRNHNHSHALTVLYYEVVRHYLVRALRRRVQPVVFVRYPARRFDVARIRAHRDELLRHLKDPALAPALRDAASLTDEDVARVRAVQEGTVARLVVRVVGGRDHLGADDRLWLLVGTEEGEIHRLNFRRESAAAHYAGDQAYHPSTVITRTFDLRARADLAGLTLDRLRELGLTFDVQGDLGGQERFQFARMSVRAVLEHEGMRRTVELLDAADIPSADLWHQDSEWWGPPLRRDALTEEERRRYAAYRTVRRHLAAHAPHYNAALALEEDPHQRAIRFGRYRFGDASLAELVENRPVGVFGDLVAFPRVATAEDTEAQRAEVLAERIVSLPTRGAFAEAKLSSCNASEVIDDTRFWDWQVSPCPDEPPEIAPLAAGSRRAAYDVAATPPPAPGVGVSDPPSAPEPFGMREVMSLLRTPDVFRDMSGIGELGPLLQKLVEVAGEVEKARIGASTQLATARPAAAVGPASGASGTASPPAGEGEARPSPQTVAREIATATRAIEQVEDPERREVLLEQLAERAVTSTASRPAPRGTGGGGSGGGGTSGGASSTGAGSEAGARTLLVQLQDHRGRALDAHGFVVCRDLVNDTEHGSGPFGSPAAGASHARIRGVRQDARAVRLELWAEDLFLNVVAPADLDRLDALIDGRIRILSGTRRVFVGEDLSGVPPALGGPSRAARQLGAHTFTLPEGSLVTSFTAQLATETRTIARETATELRSALEAELGTSSERSLGTVELTVGGVTEESSSSGTSVSVNAIFTTGAFTIRMDG